MSPPRPYTREQWNAYQREYRKTEKYKAWQKERSKRRIRPKYTHEMYLRSRASRLRADRRHNLKALYGLTEEDYERMLGAQNGLCAICQQSPKRTPHVDHCHTSGKIRDLLCTRCNIGLGFIENAEWHNSALQYLEKWK